MTSIRFFSLNPGKSIKSIIISTGTTTIIQLSGDLSSETKYIKFAKIRENLDEIYLFSNQSVSILKWY
jgi:hypothetical protein